LRRFLRKAKAVAATATITTAPTIAKMNPDEPEDCAEGETVGEEVGVAEGDGEGVGDAEIVSGSD